MRILLITGLFLLVNTCLAQSSVIPDSIISFKWENSIAYLPGGQTEAELYHYKNNHFKIHSPKGEFIPIASPELKTNVLTFLFLNL